MSGYHLMTEEERNHYYSGSSMGGFGFLNFYNQPRKATYILSITEKFNKDVHGKINQGNYVTSSIRFEEDQLIERILEIIPFWKIKEFEENKKRKFLSSHTEELKSIGVEDEVVDYIKDTILNYGKKS